MRITLRQLEVFAAVADAGSTTAAGQHVALSQSATSAALNELESVLGELMDLTPRGIRKHLDLNKPIYARTSAYGHFGREPDKEGGFSWEKTDLADELKSAMA